MGGLRFTSARFGDVSRALWQLRAGLGDFRPAFKDIVPVLAAGVQQNIQSQGGTLGKPWAPLSESALRKKLRYRKARSILHSSGRLIRYSTTPSGKRSLTKRVLRFGPPLRYPAILHFGVKGKKNLPARPFLAFSGKMRSETSAILERHARNLIQAAEDRLKNLEGK